MSDYAVLNGELYLLLDRVEGVDTSTRFQHGSSYVYKRRVFGIARCLLSEGSRARLELLSKCEFTSGPFLWAEPTGLLSTNSFVTVTDRTRHVLTLGEQSEVPSPSQLFTRHVYFTSGRELLLGCTESHFALDARTLAPKSEAHFESMLEAFSTGQPNMSGQRSVASADLRVVCIQDSQSDQSEIRVVRWPDMAKGERFTLANFSYNLISAHEQGSIIRILFTARNQDEQKLAVVLTHKGAELGRSEIIGEPVANTDCSKVVSVSRSKPAQLVEGEKLPVKVWLPDQKREFVLSADTSNTLAGMKLNRKR